LNCGSQSVSLAPVVSKNVSVVAKPIQVLSIPSSDVVAILKRVPSSSQISRSNATFPVEVVSDNRGYSTEVDCKGGKNRKTHKHTDKDGNLHLPFQLMKEKLLKL